MFSNCIHSYVASELAALVFAYVLKHTSVISVLVALASAYVETIRDGKMPCIENAVISMAVIENSRAVEEGLALYNLAMSHSVVMPTPDDKTLTDAHMAALKDAIKLFLTKAVFDSSHEYQETLNVSQNIASALPISQQRHFHGNN